MQVHSSPIRYPKKTVRFGGAGGYGAGKMDWFVGGVDSAFRKIGASRGREMIVEDLMGFGFLRTGMDLLRGYFFGHGTLNIPAAGERLFRESSSIFTDNVLSGIAALGLGKVLDKRWGAFSNGFTDFTTVELFQKAMKSGVKDEAAFLQWISQRIVQGNPSKLCPKQLETILRESVWDRASLPEADRVKCAASIAKRLGLDSFDIHLALGKGKNAPKQVFKLDNLLDDLHIFKTHMQKQPGVQAGKWATKATDSIRQTLKAKNLKLLCIGLGMASTFAVPFINVGLTKMVYGLDYYPGETGLRQPEKKSASPYGLRGSQKPPSFFERHFPYVMNSVRNGNWLPVLLAALPLPFAFGFFNTATMRLANPFKKNVLRHMFDFCKEAPFTAQQQMASIFALLITSRLLCARSDNEYRERLVDSFLGWGLWILGTPLMKKAVAAALDKHTGTVLQKVMPDGKTIALRTRSEIEHLLTSGPKSEMTVKTLQGLKPVTKQMIASTRKAHILLGAGSTLMSMILLGIVEPWAGILWTRHSEQQKAQAAGSPVNAVKPLPGSNAGFYGRSVMPATLSYAGPRAYPSPMYPGASASVYPWLPPQQAPYAWTQQA